MLSVELANRFHRGAVLFEVGIEVSIVAMEITQSTGVIFAQSLEFIG